MTLKAQRDRRPAQLLAPFDAKCSPSEGLDIVAPRSVSSELASIVLASMPCPADVRVRRLSRPRVQIDGGPSTVWCGGEVSDAALFCYQVSCRTHQRRMRHAAFGSATR